MLSSQQFLEGVQEQPGHKSNIITRSLKYRFSHHTHAFQKSTNFLSVSTTIVLPVWEDLPFQVKCKRVDPQQNHSKAKWFARKEYFYLLLNYPSGSAAALFKYQILITQGRFGGDKTKELKPMKK